MSKKPDLDRPRFSVTALVNFSDDELADLRRRIKATKWPTRIPT